VVSTDERSRVEALLARAEALSKAYRTRTPSMPLRRGARSSLGTNSVELEVAHAPA